MWLLYSQPLPFSPLFCVSFQTSHFLPSTCRVCDLFLYGCCYPICRSHLASHPLVVCRFFRRGSSILNLSPPPPLFCVPFQGCGYSISPYTLLCVLSCCRGVASINKLYGNKMAVLAGDFLLARASVRCLGHAIMIIVMCTKGVVIKGLLLGSRDGENSSKPSSSKGLRQAPRTFD